MMRTAVCCLVLSGVLMILSIRAEAFKCTVCHSRNPAMVRMHKAIQEKEIGCFDCHRVGDKLMGKGQPRERGALLQRRSTEQVCIQCHQAEGGGKQAGLFPVKP